MADDKCPECGAVLRVGDFPFCPHEPGSQSVIGDEWPGGKEFENGFETPRTFYSRSEHEAALAARGLEVRAKWVPGDKHLKRWDVPSAATLESAKTLLSRKKSDPFATAEELAEFPITVTDITFPRES